MAGLLHCNGWPEPISRAQGSNHIELSQKMIARNMVLKSERVEKLLLRILLTQHGNVLRCCLYGNTAALEQQEFFNTIVRLW